MVADHDEITCGGCRGGYCPSGGYFAASCGTVGHCAGGCIHIHGLAYCGCAGGCYVEIAANRNGYKFAALVFKFASYAVWKYTGLKAYNQACEGSAAGAVSGCYVAYRGAGFPISTGEAAVPSELSGCRGTVR